MKRLVSYVLLSIICISLDGQSLKNDLSGLGTGFIEMSFGPKFTLFDDSELIFGNSIGFSFSPMLSPNLSAGLGVNVIENTNLISHSDSYKRRSSTIAVDALFDWHILKGRTVVPMIGISAGYSFPLIGVSTTEVIMDKYKNGCLPTTVMNGLLTKDNPKIVKAESGVHLLLRVGCMFHLHERIGLTATVYGGITDTFYGGRMLIQDPENEYENIVVRAGVPGRYLQSFETAKQTTSWKGFYDEKTGEPNRRLVDNNEDVNNDDKKETDFAVAGPDGMDGNFYQGNLKFQYRLKPTFGIKIAVVLK